MMNRFKLSLIFQCLIFLIPLNIYMWGDWILVNVQWAFFRYQQSPYGNSLILGYKDMLYILNGQSTGLYNVAAAVFWTTGVIILIAGLIITLSRLVLPLFLSSDGGCAGKRINLMKRKMKQRMLPLVLNEF